MRSQSPTEGVSIELSQQGLQANPTGPISGSGRAQESASRIPGSVSGPVRTQTAVRATTGVVPSLRVSIRPQSLQAAPAAAAAAGTPSSAPDAGSLPLGVETQQWIAGLGRKTQSSASQSILRSIGLATTTIPSVGHSLAADFQHVTNRPAHRLILLNIEADFLIGSKEENYSAPNQREFVTDVARHHNQEVPFHLPRMRVRGPLPDAWYISVTGGDFFMEIPYEGAAVRVRLFSPEFEPEAYSQWRKAFDATWSFLQRNYCLIGNVPVNFFATNVHLNPTYTAAEIQRLVEAIVHFEPVLVIEQDPDRFPRQMAPSRAIDPMVRNKKFGPIPQSQALEGIKKAAENRQLCRMMQGPAGSNYAWNFSLLDSKGAIQLRKHLISNSSYSNLDWTEFTLSFLLGALVSRRSNWRQQIPANLDGLRHFMSGHRSQPGSDILWRPESEKA